MLENSFNKINSFITPIELERAGGRERANTRLVLSSTGVGAIRAGRHQPVHCIDDWWRHSCATPMSCHVTLRVNKGRR